MNLGRFLRPELILLELETTEVPEEERGELPHDRYVLSQKEKVITELADLLDRSGRVGNKGKLALDLFNRREKASTGLAYGVAIPHVRTIHAKEFLIAFARSTPGIEYGCMDENLAHLFFVMVAPPYDDTSYLKIYKQLAQALSMPHSRREFMEAESEGEILRAVKALEQG